MHPLLSCQFINFSYFKEPFQTLHWLSKCMNLTKTMHAHKSSIISCIWDVSFSYQIGSSS